ncbi:hypothetical protein FF011L_02400 [Roseimaritima multifibrata]|uniref:Uncharacterized protein n=1 Tax=Roseimaritima multifibrata TaxID=1930274 RepID=A0A517M9D8_9BACT|nr:hypothetical protein FF011L_02400 [Roseimaritima multifibrata]
MGDNGITIETNSQFQHQASLGLSGSPAFTSASQERDN